MTECGCKARIARISFNPHTSKQETDIVVDYCPLHKAAPKLLETLKAISAQFEKVEPLYTKDLEILHAAQIVIREAEGK